MTYAYDAIAMSQPSTLDPFRVSTTLEFQHTHDDDDVLVDASTLMLEGPRGAREFASMWVLYRRHGIMCDALESILTIPIGGRRRGAGNVSAQRQIMGILRWLLSCAGHGEDVLQDAYLAALDARFGTDEDGVTYYSIEHGTCVTIGELMAYVPSTIETNEWARREPPRDSTPIEWLA